MSDKPFTAPKRLVIATRESRLALWQARHVQALLKSAYPECEVELLGMTTQGDQILDKSLSKIGGKGLFVKELQTALLDGRADFAVHSLKDVPVEPQEHFSLVAILEREDPRDALVSNHYHRLEDLPHNAVVGTSSLRREAQLRAHYPHLVIKPLRGNLDTRLAKLDAGDYDAIVLASAGLKRLGLSERIRAHIDFERSLPAVGQGALGIEALSQREDLAQVLQVLNDPVTALTCRMERAVSKALGGSCQVPLGAYAEVSGETLRLRTLVAQPDGKKVLNTDHHCAVNEADQLVAQAIFELESQGAKAIIQSLLS